MDRTLQTGSGGVAESWSRRLAWAMLGLATLAFAVGSVAARPAAAGDGKDTFEGSCEFPVRVTFDPPLTNNARQTHATAKAIGRCTGTWTTGSGKTRTLDDARVLYRAESDGRQSCATSGGAAGKGFLRYRKHKLKFRFSELRVTAPAAIRLEGRRGGVFEGTATPTGDEDLVEILQQCASTGIKKAGAIISGSTQPDISG